MVLFLNHLHSQKEGIIATRPNEIVIGAETEEGYKSKIVERIYLTSGIEYHVDFGDQRLRIHTSHDNVFEQGSNVSVKFLNPRWFEQESKDVERQRMERQVF